MKLCSQFGRWLAVMLLAVGIAGCNKVDENAPSPSNSYGLSDVEVKDLTARAEKGDVDAMNRLSLFYGINQQDVVAQFMWMERAADAGDLNAREFLLEHYANQDSPDKREYGESLKRKWNP